MLRVVTWKCVSKLVETRQISNFVTKHQVFSVQSSHKTLEAQRAENDENVAPSRVATDESEKLVTSSTDDPSAMPYWLHRTLDCQQVMEHHRDSTSSGAGTPKPKYADWEKFLELLLLKLAEGRVGVPEWIPLRVI